MYVIKINLAPARFELGTFCLERIIYKWHHKWHHKSFIYSTEPQPMLYIMLFIFLFKKHLYIYIYIINKLLKKKITITIITIRNYSIIIRICYVRMRSI